MKRLFAFFLLSTAFGLPISAQTVDDTELVGLGGKCLDVFRSDTSNGAPVVLFRCHDSANQKWTVPRRGNEGPIVGLGGKCLDVANASTNNRTPIQIFSCHGGDNQRWRHDLDGRIVGLGGKCLDVADADTSDGAGIVLFDCHGDSNQRWRTRKAGQWNPANLTGTGDIRELALAPGPQGRVFAAADNGFYRSDDQGTTWQRLRPANESTAFQAVEVSPADSDRIYAGGATPPLLRSDDGGSTWTEMPATGRAINDISLHPENPDVMFITTSNLGTNVFSSSDGGHSWQPHAFNEHINSVAIAPAAPHVVYLASRQFIYRSINGGTSWSLISFTSNPLEKVIAHPNRPGTVYRVELFGIARSDDFGQSWLYLLNSSNQLSSLEITADGVLYAGGTDRTGNYGGYILRSNDDGSTWTTLDDQPQFNSQIQTLVSDPADPDDLWVGTQSHGVYSARFAVEPPSVSLNNSRFRAHIRWHDFAGNSGYGLPQTLSNDTGAFWFFGPDNIEVVVKVLDGTLLNGNFWVFYGALTNVEYTLTVTDTLTSAVRTYSNPSGNFASAGDTSAFPANAPASAQPASLDSSAMAVPASVDKNHDLFLNGRFRVEAQWRDFSGGSGSGRAVPLTSDTGTFWFFNAANTELIVKVLDGRPINGHFWVFFGALSNVEYTVTVTDVVTGQSKTYSNPSGTFASVGDTAAF